MIQCSKCGKGKMRKGKIANHNIGALVGLGSVFLTKAPALVCSACSHVMLEGTVLDHAMQQLARMIVEQAEELRPEEVRYLRETLGMTQVELAERLGISRVTLARWETACAPLARPSSLALRSIVAWYLNDAKLARQVASPGAAAAERHSPPYRLGHVA